MTDTNDFHRTARKLRNLTEPIAAGVYFAPEAHEGYTALGLNYFEGYFSSRGACLGPAPWSLVAAAFGAFKPSVVEQAITGAWTKTTPAAALEARERGAAHQLERLIGPVASAPDIARATELLDGLTDGIDPSGRSLFAGLSVLDRPQHPMGAFWRTADLVREHRGDGHIAAWIPHVDSTEITVMTELAWGIPPRTYVFTRGWTEADVDAAYERLTARGLIADGALTDGGIELREQIEKDTDRSTRTVLERLVHCQDELFGLLGPWAAAMVEGGGYPVSPKNLNVSG